MFVAFKLFIIVGTRPNFIKITQFEKELKLYGSFFQYKLIHTGQHFDQNMSQVFFEQLGLREPDFYLNVRDMDVSTQFGNIIVQLGKIFKEEQPDLVIVVGDVNSTAAAAIAANKCGIKVAHLESGLRSGDRSMPEEINRLITDQIADFFFVTEQSGWDHLIKEGINKTRLFMVGNTMIDTMAAFDQVVEQSTILDDLNLIDQPYALMTMHRPANVDHPDGLNQLSQIIEYIISKTPLVFPVHPRTRKNFQKFGFNFENWPGLVLCDPLDYLAFQKLIAHAKFVLTDSGGIQEETTYKKIPCLTLRENTERPVTISLGSNTLTGMNFESIKRHLDTIESGTYKKGQAIPLWDGQATQRIVKIIHDVIAKS